MDRNSDDETGKDRSWEMEFLLGFTLFFFFWWDFFLFVWEALVGIFTSDGKQGQVAQEDEESLQVS